MLSRTFLPHLPTAEWREREAAHRRRAEVHTLPARKRRDSREPNPVEDFLFEYYPYPLALLEKWHPGAGVALEWDSSTLPAPFSDRCYSLEDGFFFVDASLMPSKERQRLGWIRELLVATRDRAPNFACHGLHEWAMVYRGRDVRHGKTTPLRLPQVEIDALVETRAICCSHHDAFRFFAEEARPMNRLQPDLHSRAAFEQPGCVHANMDLYKWAAKAMPWIGTELLLDCFELANDLRDLDMRASPYDLTAWGREPIRIETQDGRRAYETEQRRLALLAAPLRERLIVALEGIVA
ncbi:hypothetical protein JIN84_21865 [Luteolibacter yonseiensis]|uniref:3-methyladenine DNA glycosylase n=1 Tax=Luteolibacter yonseiensis TaxID=1144680 RepID=A0A934R4J8_9BACT|nr:hypothetical protein [Luteolibacter yonseiensis]MBK1818283.1 hypothetical protein [Luteolibacter yonseiensis]